MKRAVDVDLPPVSLDRRRALPQQIAEAICAAIQSGRLRVNDRIPSTRAFARALGVSRQVIVVAYEELASTGHIHGRVGDGSYVACSERPCWLTAPVRIVVDPDGYLVRIGSVHSDVGVTDG